MAAGCLLTVRVIWPVKKKPGSVIRTGSYPWMKKINMRSVAIIVFVLCASIAQAQKTKTLDTVLVKQGDQKHTGFTRLRDVEGTAIYAGKKTEVVEMKDVVGNKATNNSR